jgi:hypothetical protein
VCLFSSTGSKVCLQERSLRESDVLTPEAVKGGVQFGKTNLRFSALTVEATLSSKILLSYLLNFTASNLRQL